MIFGELLFYVYFVYGVSFLVMGYIVFHGIRNATSITLITTFYSLALFGLIHGTTEIIDWIRFILRTTGHGEIDILKYLSQAFLIISFVILLQFGVNLLTYRNKQKRIFRLIPAGLFGVYVIVILVMKVDDISRAGLIARYSIGFSGALLSGIALCTLANAMKAVGTPRVIKGLLVTAIGFAAYAVFGGLITEPLAGLPIQLFRSACAFTIAISSFFILGVFKASE